MRVKLTLLAVACLIVGGVFLATTHKADGPITTQKTDRAAATSFLAERFAG